ncbi:redoxin domain-containing protein [Aureimonas fodinaquatilis]|uniref:Redoxin domain-containing protein n=1 Tax=Aureimonas fodinaquatilis TaxID=2565783 RepID=A0A5B0DSF7_9HYPH|nr:2OG-Fe(II) oxygenase [Aureimonas fodinaquatilis]KAA0968925.1 redoxin domain-containing protein [Aureimonas fodinaquatilis]
MNQTSVSAEQKFKVILPGDPAPLFKQNSSLMDGFNFDKAAGRYIVMCFYGTSEQAESAAALDFIDRNRALLDSGDICLFAVSIDPEDKQRSVFARRDIRQFWDFDRRVSGLYGVVPLEGELSLRPHWFVLDPTLRIMKVLPFQPDGSEREELARFVRNLPPSTHFAGIEVPVPVLVIPNVFEAEFCRHLISLYDNNGGEESGVMRDIEGRTVPVMDFNYKRRSDYNLENEDDVKMAKARIARRVVPEIQKVHQFNVTRMERYLVGCYDSVTGGHFTPHRDNTTKGTAHRRFAISINLNADFEGGEVSFPEYGPRGFKAPPGTAVVFSCSLLHAVSKVTSGRRYAFLPFVYDEAAAKIRDANRSFLAS